MNGASSFGKIEGEARGRTAVRLFSVLAIAAFSVTITVWSLALLWTPIADPGLVFKADTIVSVDPESPGGRAGLHVGDRFDPKTPFFVRNGVGIYAGRWPAVYSFDVTRNGVSKHITLSIAPKPGDFMYTGRDAVFYVCVVLVSLISALIGTVVVLLRPSRLTWMLFLFCIGDIPNIGPLIILANLPMPLGFVLNLARSTLLIAALFAFVDIALRFPSNEARGWKKRVAQVLPVFAVAYWAYVTPFSWLAQFYPASRLIPEFVDANLTFMVLAALFLTALVSLLDTYGRSGQEAQQRLKWITFGIALGYAGVIGKEVIKMIDVVAWLEPWLGWTIQFLALLVPLAIAYAILMGRVVDVRFVVNRAVVYFGVTSSLAAVLASTYWLTGVFLQQTRAAAAIQLLVAIAAGMFFHRVYRQLETGINRLLFKRRYEAQEHLERLAGGLSRADSIQELEMLVVSEPVIALDLACGALFRRNETGRFVRTALSQSNSLPAQLAGDDPLIVRSRAHHEPLSLSSRLLRKIGSGLAGQPLALVLPLYVDDALYAVVMYGPHENGADLDPTEKSAIRALQEPAERRYATLQRQAETVRQLSALLEHTPSDASDETHAYLATQLVDAIPERTRLALLACSAVPRATGDDIVCATEGAESADLLREFAKSSPIVHRREDGSFAVLELVARALQKRLPTHSREMVIRCARRSSEKGDGTRAARLFELAGLQAAAAQELEKALAAADPALLIRANESLREVAEFDIELVSHRPHLWIQRSAMRLFRDTMASVAKESVVVRNAYNNDSAMPGLFNPWCAYLYAESGQLGAAAALRGSPPSEERTSFVAQFRTTIASLVVGRLGRLAECSDVLDTIAGIQTEECRALKELVRASIVERARGRWNQERAGIDAAIDALTSCDSRFAVWALAEGVVGAWLVGQERARLSYLKRLDAAIAQYNAPAFAYLATASIGEPGDSTNIESSRWLTWSYLIATCGTASWRGASSFAAQALDAAVDAGEPFLHLLARIACAEFDEANRYEHLRQVLELSKAIDSPPLAASVRAYVADDENVGVLERFLVRLRQDRNNDGATLTIELASGKVRRGAQIIALSERELAVALALGRSSKSMSAMELSELIWPDLDEAAGAHAMQTCMHRLRQRLGDPRAVENTTHGYRLRDDVVVDVFELETLMQGVKTDEELDELTALRLAAAAKHLDSSRPAFMTGWEWFAPTERRIEEWYRMAKHRLAEDALRRKSYDQALQLAQQVIVRDELDEPAWEIVLRALVESGDRAGAQRELRRYREVTLRELNAEPSKELYDLLESAQPGARRILRVVGK